jgi:hypothetical protein
MLKKLWHEKIILKVKDLLMGMDLLEDYSKEIWNKIIQ